MQLIIGYGNPLRGDDGLGYVIACQLDAQSLCKDVDILACHQLTPELVEYVRKADRVVFVDAREGSHTGQISIEEITPEKTLRAFTHNVTPASLLYTSEVWYGTRPEAYLVSISGMQFGFDEQLSSYIQVLVPEVIQHIYELLKLPLKAKQSFGNGTLS